MPCVCWYPVRARQWHSIGTRCGINRPMGFEHNLMMTLPDPPDPLSGPGRRTVPFVTWAAAVS